LAKKNSGCLVTPPLFLKSIEPPPSFDADFHAMRVQVSIHSHPTTATWCRYALRQKLLPCIEATYGAGAHRNLASLAVASDALHDEVGQVDEALR
jgi:hypothetical protein